MRLRTTHTFVKLELSESAWNEIATKLLDAGYQHAFVNELTIDMQGIAVSPEEKREEAKEEQQVFNSEGYANLQGS